MAKTGKCIECGANRIIKRDLCKKCRSNGVALVEEEEESE